MHEIELEVWGRPPGKALFRRVRTFDDDHWQAAEKMRLALEQKGWDADLVEVEIPLDDEDEDDEDDDGSGVWEEEEAREE